jgi:TonB family protein
MARTALRRLYLPVLMVLAALAISSSIAAAQSERGEPRIVEVDQQPSLRNGADMARLLDARYPPQLKEAGIEGGAEVWLYIDELGRVRETRLKETSGYIDFDEAAESVARLMSFAPARMESGPIAVWVPMMIRFRQSAEEAPGAKPSAAGAPAAHPPAAEPPAAGQKIEKAPPARTGTGAAEDRIMAPIEPPAEKREDLSDSPTFTPMTVRPALQNPGEVSEALRQFYPPELRDAGIGGVTNMWFFIDEEGVVRRAVVNESSGYDPFDDAAMEVGKVMRFSPARNRDEVVPVWVALNIRFDVQ